MRLEELVWLPRYGGIYFDPASGMTYRADGSSTGFTFERPRWSGPCGLGFWWPWLSPMPFATAETASSVFAWVRAAAPPSLAVTLEDKRKRAGPFTRTLERRILLTDLSGRSQSFSAGSLAHSIISNGAHAAAEAFMAEWRSAGLRF